MNRLHFIALALALAATPVISFAYSADRADAEAECRSVAELDHITADELDDFMEDCVAEALEAPEGDQEPAPVDNR